MRLGNYKEAKMQIPQSLTLEDLRRLSLEKVFQSIAASRISVTVTLESGSEVLIQPKPRLEPLPVLKGFVPQGWKEGIYDEPQ